MIVSQPTLEPLRRWDPDQIGPYTLLGRLGAGAMGQVYLGRSTAGRLVAVKTIKIELAEEPGFRARFAREVAAARRVSGVFTAAVVAANPEAEMPWLATAYVPAPTLSKLVRVCGPLPVPSVLWLAAGCAEALESIHLAGLVHRDLKPSNVLVAPDGPRVIDFGVARAAERVQLTVTRGAVGTPAYMAPEQARDSQHASPASDVYSLGATLLFAATGHGPYQGDTVMDVLVKLATEQPDMSGLPAEVASLIKACLERSPRHRPTSAALLNGLGPFVEATADPAETHNYLPGSAMALIAEYQRSPQPAVLAAGDPDAASEDPTSASHTGLTAAQLAPASHRQQRRREPSAGDTRNRPPYAPHVPHVPHLPQRRQARIAVVASGVVLGAGVLAIAGAYVGPRVDPGLAVTATSTAGPVPPVPPPGADPPQTPASGTSTTPKLTLGQAYGDGNTGFQVHGSGFDPGTRVVVSIAGSGSTPLRQVSTPPKDEPVTDPKGTFNYTIDQGHVFFPGEIPDGTYHVVARDATSRQQATSSEFRVAAPPGRPPSGPPPTGFVPPPQGLGAPAARPGASGALAR
jgi:serine/threonine protein kinase